VPRNYKRAQNESTKENENKSSTTEKDNDNGACPSDL
jgi:hypothetical protein